MDRFSFWATSRIVGRIIHQNVPPKDGIPPIDTPQFISVNEADEWLKDREPVVFVQVGDDVLR